MYPKESEHNLRVITKGILMGKQRIHLQQMSLSSSTIAYLLERKYEQFTYIICMFDDCFQDSIQPDRPTNA